MLVHGPRHAKVGELDGARGVDEAVPEIGDDLILPPKKKREEVLNSFVRSIRLSHLHATSLWTYLSSAR